MDIGCSLPPQEELHPEDVVPPRLLKKHKPKQVTHTHTHMHACTHTHTCTQTHTHACMHTRTHHAHRCNNVLHVCVWCNRHVDFICPSTQIVRNILEAHSSMLNLTLMEARMKYIRNWMALQDFGVALFLVRFHRAKKDVSGSRCTRMGSGWSPSMVRAGPVGLCRPSASVAVGHTVSISSTPLYPRSSKPPLFYIALCCFFSGHATLGPE